MIKIAIFLIIFIIIVCSCFLLIHQSSKCKITKYSKINGRTNYEVERNECNERNERNDNVEHLENNYCFDKNNCQRPNHKYCDQSKNCVNTGDISPTDWNESCATGSPQLSDVTCNPEDNPISWVNYFDVSNNPTGEPTAEGGQSMFEEEQSMFAEKQSMVADEQSMVADEQSMVPEQSMFADEQSMVPDEQSMIAEEQSMFEEKQSMVPEPSPFASEYPVELSTSYPSNVSISTEQPVNNIYGPRILGPEIDFCNNNQITSTDNPTVIPANLSENNYSGVL